jgi:site-specific DNA-adenine methylase
MRYPGGKGKTYQQVINLMPPHDVYIETHLGGGAVLRQKRPANRNIGIDADERVIAHWREHGLDAELVCARAEDFLATFDFAGSEVVYVDPPFVPETRRRSKVYRCDYTREDHERLLTLLLRLPCRVLLSGYASSLYEDMLRGWNEHTFTAATHSGTRQETIWFNFEPPKTLHDSRYLGDTFRTRQATKRRLERLQRKVTEMDARERGAFAQWLYESFPEAMERT